MIAKLTGLLADTTEAACVIDVGGVGYLVHASARTLSGLGALGETVTLFTQMQVSENDMRLIGFASSAERDTFGKLTGVQGVGGKVALAILSALTPEELARAVSSADAAMIARAQGVGPKLAKRIANELKDAFGGIALGGGATGSMAAPSGGLAADAVSALTNLGFKPNEAVRAVGEAESELDDGASLDALVRLALKKAAK